MIINPANLNNIKIGAIIRANFENADFQPKDVLDGLVPVLCQSKYISLIILAFPENVFHRNLKIQEKKVHIFYGNPSDMIERMISLADLYHLDTIVDVSVRGQLEPAQRIDEMIEYHCDQNGGFTEAAGCRPDILPKIIDTVYLKKIYDQSIAWPYYETIYSDPMGSNYYQYPSNFLTFKMLDKMNGLQLAAAGEKIKAILETQAGNPENPESWFTRAESLKKQIRKYKEQSNISVLEIGCGKRFGLGIILSLMNGFEYTGADISAINVVHSDVLCLFEYLKNKIKSSGKFDPTIQPDFGFKKSEYGYSFFEEKVRILSSQDASRLPFKEDSFDVIFSDAVMEHVSHPEEVCNEMNRVLKPDGVMFHSIDFGDHHPDGSGQRFLSVSKQFWRNSCQQVYINLLRFSEIDCIFKSFGFEYLSCTKGIRTDGFEINNIHKDWDKYDREDLKISNASVVLKKR
ncbi:MAG: class I SAM-dependent methyltransferase [Proteobacteria bacterium]|nr:class I SAM-dependent methyltransferase [Desulfobacula sp.]MBU3952695.1 class I SAM-dependent methyltransferase [Pseudomonadota bacterium]MBU4132008.1 class I SAM-dependent methyltransferase [Pseudomonadota bacterium]